MDNMIEVYGMRRLAKALPVSTSIVTLSLDYNEWVNSRDKDKKYRDIKCQGYCKDYGLKLTAVQDNLTQKIKIEIVYM